MKIISVPHPTLRTVSTEVTKVDKKLHQFIHDLEDTLWSSSKPRGVGLAAPQVNIAWRIFVTQLEENKRPTHPSRSQVQHYINPKIIDHSDHRTFGEKKDEPILEGCLSIPKIYGPVPRYEWVKLEYQVVLGDGLETRHAPFQDFAARVIQHELDHLDGILFIDYSLSYDLPIYQENPKTGKLKELDPLMMHSLAQPLPNLG